MSQTLSVPTLEEPSMEEQLRRRERELRAVHRITAALRARTQPHDLVCQTLLTAIETVHAVAGSILIHEPESDSLVFRHVVGASPEIAAKLCGRTMPADAGIAGRAFRSGQGFVTPDVSADSLHYREIDRVTRYSTRNMIAVPLKSVEGDVLGVMEVLNRKERMFDEEDLAVLEILAAQAASTMQNAALHARILASEREKERFCREVIRCVTQDQLLLVEPEEIPTEGEVAFELSLDQPSGYGDLRTRLLRAALEAGMTETDATDLVLAAGETATNAIKHASSGVCNLRTLEDRLTLRVSDAGEGIRPEHLPSALFRAGFSTKVSLGMGYTLMLALVDRIWLATGPTGTTVQLEKWLRPQEHEQEALLAALARF